MPTHTMCPKLCTWAKCGMPQDRAEANELYLTAAGELGCAWGIFPQASAYHNLGIVYDLEHVLYSPRLLTRGSC